jgi:hypothetical protein
MAPNKKQIPIREKPPNLLFEKPLFQDVVVRDVQLHRPALPLCQGGILVCLTKPPKCVGKVQTSPRWKLPRLICQKDQPVQMVNQGSAVLFHRLPLGKDDHPTAYAVRVAIRTAQANS